MKLYRLYRSGLSEHGEDPNTWWPVDVFRFKTQLIKAVRYEMWRGVNIKIEQVNK